MNDLLVLVWIGLEASILLVCTVQLRVAWHRYRWKNDKISQLSLADTPTISVCIPARNETHALTDCLEKVLSSDYPKLEIIVLDDCSQDNTSQLIRSFAHDGVRFIEGVPPPEGWLGRNYALESLAKAATGKYIIFMGVDTRLAPGTITQLANYMFAKRARMASVLPQRETKLSVNSLFSSLRYFWQILAPQFSHTPVATALWMVRADAIAAAGGFAAYKNEVLPEKKFAELFAMNNTYRFLISEAELGASYTKKWSSQVETALRQYFPAFGKNLPLAITGALAVLIIGLSPIVLAALYVRSSTAIALILCLLAVGFGWLYAVFASLVQKQPSVLHLLLFPVLVVQEALLIIASAVAYITGKVNWKNRNICYPVTRRMRD